MGVTIDFLRGRRPVIYLTCDRCGLPILDRAVVEPPAGDRDYDRYSHPGPCPDEDKPPTKALPAKIRQVEADATREKEG